MKNKLKITCLKLATNADDLELEKRLHAKIVKDCGVSERTVRSWLANQRQPSAKHMPILHQVLSESGYEGEIADLFFSSETISKTAKRLNLKQA